MRHLLHFMTTLLCITILGCSARPKEDHTYVIVENGDPIQILDKKGGKGETVIITGKTLKSGQTATQDITGWVVMPPDHWRVIKEDLTKLHPESTGTSK